MPRRNLHGTVMGTPPNREYLTPEEQADLTIIREVMGGSDPVADRWGRAEVEHLMLAFARRFWQRYDFPRAGMATEIPAEMRGLLNRYRSLVSGGQIEENVPSDMAVFERIEKIVETRARVTDAMSTLADVLEFRIDAQQQAALMDPREKIALQEARRLGVRPSVFREGTIEHDWMDVAHARAAGRTPPPEPEAEAPAPDITVLMQRLHDQQVEITNLQAELGAAHADMRVIHEAAAPEAEIEAHLSYDHAQIRDLMTMLEAYDAEETERNAPPSWRAIRQIRMQWERSHPPGFPGSRPEGPPARPAQEDLVEHIDLDHQIITALIAALDRCDAPYGPNAPGPWQTVRRQRAIWDQAHGTRDRLDELA